jgi:hypothetical protein
MFKSRSITQMPISGAKGEFRFEDFIVFPTKAPTRSFHFSGIDDGLTLQRSQCLNIGFVRVSCSAQSNDA